MRTRCPSGTLGRDPDPKTGGTTLHGWPVVARASAAAAWGGGWGESVAGISVAEISVAGLSVAAAARVDGLGCSCFVTLRSTP
ncbi:hypothetical protein PAPYR_59 [Paratrimastix pyriformis]|uniref:Uncharacterized protein n=1 Tax=Paratrimastix pyriformis TaxID=342808 RepID=A0ABQ8UWM6_9EUKA|nr:hypothetical protein PAPYR_59 [Paratrimastix pyriformis]